ncbi:unnamed protein product [Fusarium langsethiae]|nr:unnamed protein product [Fusarium langsethiae]
MPYWNVQEFSVTTSTGNSAEIYANGRMQCSVTVLIKAFDPKTQTCHVLSDQELELIELVDYEVPDGKALSGEWVYTTKENEFSHIITHGSQFANMTAATSPPTTDPVTAAGSEFQNVPFWVSATKEEAKKIGARITTPSKETFTTHSDSFKSYISVIGRAPVIYNKKNTTLSWEQNWKECVVFQPV